MSKPDSILIAEIHLFADGDYEYTGRTVVMAAAPTGTEWNLHSMLPEIISTAVNKFGPAYEGFEVFGAINHLYLS